MTSRSVTIDWKVFQEWSEAILAIVRGGQLDVFTSYSEMSAVVASDCLMLYQGYLKGERLPNGASVQHPSGALSQMAVLKSGPGFCEWALTNDAAYAESVEKGSKERDLKEMLPNSKMARRAKDGSLYLIIPFRHGTPGTVGLKGMPTRVYQMAKNLSRSSITGHRSEISGTGHAVQRNVYQWGGHLNAQHLAKAGIPFKQQNRYQGMVKFGVSGHSSYMTFRVMSEKSAGWIVPARPGLWPARTAAEVSLRDSTELLNEAILDDVKRLAGIT